LDWAEASPLPPSVFVAESPPAGSALAAESAAVPAGRAPVPLSAFTAASGGVAPESPAFGASALPLSEAVAGGFVTGGWLPVGGAASPELSAAASVFIPGVTTSTSGSLPL